MSWFFCIWDKNNFDESYQNIHDLTDTVYNDKDIYLAVGGASSTHFFEFDEQNKKGWLVCGVGLKNDDYDFRVMNFVDWRGVIDREEINLDSINGHYVILKFSQNKLEIYTDNLGLRDVYYSKRDGRYFLSTRIEWLSDCVNTEIDFEIFSSRWLLFNQITKKSFLNNINRLVAGEFIVIQNGEIKLSEARFEFDFRNGFEVEEYEKLLRSIISAAFRSDNTVALSLSGGLDSRVLLSFLLDYNFNGWSSHTFGDPKSPDSVVVKKLINLYGITHKQFHTEPITQDNAIKIVEDYSERSQVTNPVSIAFHMSNYYKFADKKLILIDGGFGEIWRREFFNKLFFLGKSHLFKQNYNAVIPYLKFNRVDVFDSGLIKEMNHSCVVQLEEIFSLITDIQNIGAGNWLDVFAIKTRLANYYSHEQNKVDEIIQNFMPFVQQRLLSKILQLNLQRRKSGKLFRELIRINKYSLTKYPLAKNDLIYPFHLGSFTTRLYSMINKKLSKKYPEDGSIQLFKLLKDYILDLINSSQARNYYAYDKVKLEALSNEFNKGDKNCFNQIDWWLSFELFRHRIMNNKKVV